jgi:acetoin utilization protein AcuC
MSDRKKLFLYTPQLEIGGYPDACPFNTHRAGQTRSTIEPMGLLAGSSRSETAPEPVTESELASFHTAEYLDCLKRGGQGVLKPEEALWVGLGTPDCPVFDNMYDYVALAAGGSLTGARRIISGEAAVAFNPSGGFHHAQAGHAAGFCYVNDIVVAAEEFAKAGMRVLFLDIDVHHCDGVQDAFFDRSEIMTISLHESGRTLFPGTGFEDEIGTGGGRGYTVNFPLPVGTHDAAYEKVFRQGALPLIRQFDPDVIILELGMDALAGDPLAHLHLTNNTHALITEEIVSLGKPVLATGGGGYNIPNTVRGWALCWSVLCGEHSMHDDLSFGMGGVMLENTDWAGGLRDRVLLADGGRHDRIGREIDRVLDAVRTTVFPMHSL